MKSLLLKVYHFLGGVVFAIILISLTALLVIGGTFMESHTGSHLYAAGVIYDSLVFAMLLWGFFINILFAALRRWPFKRRHIPFLITHLGLLMILAGVLFKHYNGVQGAMFIFEGSSTDQMMLPDSLALRIDTPDSARPVYLDVPTNSASPHPALSLTTNRLFPHCCERLDTFIKGNWLVLLGNPPIPVGTPVKMVLSGSEHTVYAIRHPSPTEAIFNYYRSHAKLLLTSNGAVEEVPLQEALDCLFNSFGSTFTASFHNETVPEVIVVSGKQQIRIPLTGNKPLANNTNTPLLGAPWFSADIAIEPTILFIEDDHKDLLVVAIGAHGDFNTKKLDQNSLGTLYTYDSGYGGYSTQIGLKVSNSNRQTLEQLQLDELKKQIANTTFSPHELTPPLQLLWNACKRCDENFADISVDYLAAWSASGHWLYPPKSSLPPHLGKVLSHVDWTALPENTWKGCAWSCGLIQNIEEQAKAGTALIDILEANQWPFAAIIKADPQSENDDFVLAAFTHQIYAAADELPPYPSKTYTPIENAHLLSSLCRAYDIHLTSIEFNDWVTFPTNEIVLESPLTTHQKLTAPTTKIEENVPLVVLGVKSPSGDEEIALGYDRQAAGLKWPIGNGTALVRFQPRFETLPYEVRLRRGRQISYPNSSQPYSYESDLIFTDKSTGLSTEATISMNNVHETWDGYRFYLSSMAPNDESSAKRIQLAVNLDPAKYFLTYPGAIILAIGILLLFWLRPYKKR